MTDWGALAEARLHDLSAISEPGPGVTRLPFTPEHRAAVDLISSWMEEAGMSVSLDDAGTLVGRLEGPDNSGTFYLGSHQDSVREGGAYDGIMGVVLPLLAIRKLRDDGISLPFCVEILAFADEEGVRFPTALVGSRAIAGTFDASVLKMVDVEGVSLEQSLRDFGLHPDRIPTIRRPRPQAIGYLETHIEQGPTLEAADQALGIVTAICGIERHQVTITGKTGHAGTLPMSGRQDALVAAAELITQVKRLAEQSDDIRGTVGQLFVAPNVVNAVPREVRMTAEFRSPDDPLREAAGQALHRFAENLASRTGMKIDILRSYAQPAQPCDERFRQILYSSIRLHGGTGLSLSSGATHDASAMADLCPIAMLFVRCLDGQSHTPEEFASSFDMARAVEVIADFLQNVAGPAAR